MTKKRAVLAIPLVVLMIVVAVAALLAARGGGVESAGGASDESGSSAGEPAAKADTGAVTDGSERAAAQQVGAVTPVSRAIISTGQVTLQTKEMARARAEIIRMVTAWGGVVADEQSTSDDRGRLIDSTLTLRVPSPRFNDAMTAFDTLGDVVQRSRSSEDVTTKVVDNDARVRAAERSIRRIEALLSRAGDLGEVIAIENDLARRQADLDSLKSQQAWLDDQTTLSTVNVYLNRPPKQHETPETDEAKGFLAGLGNGWDALTGATVVALTVVGAVLPFGVLAAMISVPVWLVVRRRRVAPLPPAEA